MLAWFPADTELSVPNESDEQMKLMILEFKVLPQRWSDSHRDGHDIAGIGTKQKEGTTANLHSERIALRGAKTSFPSVQGWSALARNGYSRY
jgi:hypothetical protein